MNLLRKIVDVRTEEVRALFLAFVFNFVVLGGYYVIRPIRDEIGADRGVENLPWMYTGTLIGMLLANALYAVVVARMSRRQFIPIAYRFAIANLFVFFLLMRWMPAAQERSILAPIFFVCVRRRRFAETPYKNRGATNRRQILGRRDAYCSISLLTRSGGVSHDLHAHEHVGIFSTI